MGHMLETLKTPALEAFISFKASGSKAIA